MQLYWVEGVKERRLVGQLSQFSTPDNFEWRYESHTIPVTSPSNISVCKT